MEKNGHPLPLVTRTYTQVTTVTSMAVAKSYLLSKLAVDNSCDTDIILSFSSDGSIDHMFCAAGDARVMDNIRVGTDIWIKSVTSNPTAGNVRIERYAADMIITA